jgi:hypothetical protein
MLTMVRNGTVAPKREKDKWVPRALYDKRLHTMLQYKRPHGSHTERNWADALLTPYDAQLIDDSAWVVTISRPDGSESNVLFSSHVDTVHRSEGRQKVWFDPKEQCYFKDDGEPLGADDAAGVWLMLEMMDAKVPGTYVFHRGEERGGIGSTHMARVRDKWLASFDAAIAFDRRGSYDVITHQGFGRCCSDEFAQALADALSTGDLMYMPCDTGVFTDTANYVDSIPECTNVSCGYDWEHTGMETLHLPTLFALRDALLKVEWDTLPIKRDPTEVEDWGYSHDSWLSRPAHAGYLSFDLEDCSHEELLDQCYANPESFVDRVWTELLGRKLPKTKDEYEDDDPYSAAGYC